MPLARLGSFLLLGLCALGCQRELETRSDLPSQPEVLSTDYATVSVRAKRTLASELRQGECVTQDDCPSDQICVALAPSHAECVERASMNGLERPKRAPNGRPAAPLRLLDGQVLRDHAERSGP